MPSPTRDSIPTLAPHLVTEISAPPSPRTHRALRKLQSAHNLGATARTTAQPSLISQQRLLHQERNVSPTRKQASTRSPQRTRANSDAASPGNLQPAMSLHRKRSALSRTSAAADGMSLERLIRDGPPDGDVKAALESTRLKVLDQGIKADTDGMSSVRIYVWLILLDAPVMGTDEYLSLIHRGASPAYSKIRNDTFRTLTTDPLFRRRVSEASLIRLLNAIAWKMHDSREVRRPTSSRQSLPAADSRPGSRPGSSRTDISMTSASSPAGRTSRSRALTLTDSSETSVAEYSSGGTYVQGMNVLAAPFLYAARSEAEAFVAFHRLLTKECPAYIRGAMVGVHKGLALVDKVLAIVDARLHIYLVSKGLSAEIYAFPSVLTLCACTPPLPEVLRLWDFLFAYGPHLNILCIVAQLIIMRNELLGSNNPNKLLRSFPSLHADQIKRTALAIVKMIPDDIYAEIVTHAL
ncbi:TBC-domain-containing protein [Apiospora arundinis]|uniref:Rab-GTPase-TBC domain-containing protein n=1 Tax=Apiospora arundinis TaxID=335852 RepID=A0ABR2J990_9PEZI